MISVLGVLYHYTKSLDSATYPNVTMDSQSSGARCPDMRRQNTATFRSVTTSLCCLLLATMTGASAQENEGVCACTPPTYEFTFNFGLECSPPGGDDGPGIAEATCFVTSFSSDVEDYVPVAVQTVSIIEADVDRIPIAQSAVDGDFEDGDTFTYSSVSALGNSTQIPQSIQLTITGVNEIGDTLVQVWAIKFTNDCGVYPVLEVGESYGWTDFVSLQKV